jgi:predicted ATPase
MADGIAQMQQGLQALEGQGEAHQQSIYLAEAYGRSGQVEAGLALLANARVYLQATGQRINASLLYRVQGELLLALSPEQQKEAECCFHQALGVACQQQAKGLELRAALCLSRLWQRQGKRQEAHKLLASIYGWFTEGFDTADLQEAQAFLRQLSIAP